ncbi:hypothetical protein QWY93_12920 [Echinicola jeungdonensis]|uniref:Outer membrane protein beta-barrel domain-containing protein n=1 Tax=Echinicola jeungdonensis TaxID=709343 RepID=A0ABV5JAH8_9BACT|nr:hypothetical protein [Echinicola jeungdonensis]MDN3670227.1 hypothetical protein [Echinicola jeungdonensis]
MKIRLLTLLMVLLSNFSMAQEANHPTEGVFLELGGAGLVYSFNYDFRFDKKDQNSWGMRAGVGGYSLNDNASLLTLPIQVNKLLGSGKHFFEIGAGGTFIYYRNKGYSTSETYNPVTNEYTYSETRYTDKDFDFILNSGETPALMGTLNLGYRKIPENGGFLFSVNVIPIFNHNGFWPLWAGMGFGYAF